jgi:hypothetical protein
MRRWACLAVAVLWTSPAAAWGPAGHRMIGELAIRRLPADLPAFLRTPLAASQVGLLAQEPDISRNAGQPHDWDSDPGHFIDVLDDGTVLGGPKLSALPGSRRDYDTALRQVGANEYAAGFLPYNMIDGWQQLVKDFALLRAEIAGEKSARTRAERDHFAAYRAVRQMLVLRDLGIWAHYVGDASQPLHVTVHYNGWGDYPNPDGFVAQPGLHAKFESDFVNAHVTEADVAARMVPYQSSAAAIDARMARYLADTATHVRQVYQFEKDGAFDAATPAAREFTAARIAAGAAMLRDLVVDAWHAAADVSLGYKVKATVRDIEAGKASAGVIDQ